MNREIKFRAWDKQEKKMYEVRSLHNIHSGVNIHADLCTDSIPAVKSNHYDMCDHQDSFVYMQFTGLLDKNGKEIFEGDIVEYNDSRIGRAQVQWKECYFELLFPSGNVNFITTDRIRNHDIEVIGNIYESKHLLDNTDTKV